MITVTYFHACMENHQPLTMKHGLTVTIMTVLVSSNEPMVVRYCRKKEKEKQYDICWKLFPEVRADKKVEGRLNHSVSTKN